MIAGDDVEIRLAREEDAEGVREVFRVIYGADYPYPEYLEIGMLKRMIFGDDTVMFVARDRASGQVVGTASVLLEIGAFSDLVGEFGRLGVLPEARSQQIGTRLMRARLDAVRNQLHVGVVEARVIHGYSVRIASKQGFSVVGYSPLRHQFRTREGTSILAQWFGDALSLRFNNPRIASEIHALASASLAGAGLPVDPIVDEHVPPYPRETGFEFDELTSSGYSKLLRIERGRVRNRVVFGPMRLHYGFFKLTQKHAAYLIARDGDRVAAALGYIRDEHDKCVRIFELIAPDDRAVDCVFRELERRCREEWNMAVLEVDIRANTPGLQRTLLSIGFVPEAYVPAMVFHEVERYDVIRMARLLVPPDIGDEPISEEALAIRKIVLGPLRRRQAAPLVKSQLSRVPWLDALTTEQAELFASTCTVRRFERDRQLYAAGDPGDAVYVILEGRVNVLLDGTNGTVGPGEVLGEMGLLTQEPHSATAVTAEPIETLVVSRTELNNLIDRRPDIGLAIYRHLAEGLARKLRRADRLD